MPETMYVKTEEETPPVELVLLNPSWSSSNHPGDLVKMQLLIGGLKWDPRLGFSNKHHDDISAVSSFHSLNRKTVEEDVLQTCFSFPLCLLQNPVASFWWI